MEQNNSDRIILLKQGGFYRAYEHSAYFFYHQVKPYQLMKKSPTVLKGDTLVCLGFQSSKLSEVMGKRPCLLNTVERMEYKADGEIVVQAYAQWKDELPLYQIAYSRNNPVQEPEQKPNSDSELIDSRVVREIRAFDLLKKTPFECMMFLDHLKAILSGN